MLNAGVLSLGVLTDENRVDIIVRCLESLNGDARPDISEEVKRPTESKVQRNVTLAN